MASATAGPTENETPEVPEEQASEDAEADVVDLIEAEAAVEDGATAEGAQGDADQLSVQAPDADAGGRRRHFWSRRQTAPEPGRGPFA
jgi:hypothetical protein